MYISTYVHAHLQPCPYCYNSRINKARYYFWAQTNDGRALLPPTKLVNKAHQVRIKVINLHNDHANT